MEKELSVVYGMYNLREEREQARWSLGYIMDDFADIKKRYVSLGFHLNEFKRCEYYKDFGYVTFEEFCTANIPLDKGSISRCISVFENFAAVDTNAGYKSRKMWLDDRYKEYSYSQLVEMVSLSSPVQTLIPSDMTVAKIREVEVISENEEKTAETRELPNLPKTSEIANALITIQNDLFCSESVLDLGKKYVSYQDILKQLFLKALDKVCE